MKKKNNQTLIVGSSKKGANSIRISSLPPSRMCTQMQVLPYPKSTACELKFVEWKKTGQLPISRIC